MMQPRGRARVGWELVRILQASVMALEETASRVLAAQVAGTIALWSQLYTFEERVPAALAWTALTLFIVSLSFLGLFLRPRRIVRFWDRAIPDELFAAKRPVTQEEEASTIDHVSTAMLRHRDRLERAIGVALPLGVAALLLAALAYGLDKAFYSG
jgi:hypothetical protein